MPSHRFTITPPSPNPGTFWVDIDASGSPLAGVQVDTPVTLNPVDKTVNLTYAGLAVAFVSATNIISVGVKSPSSTPFDVLISIP